MVFEGGAYDLISECVIDSDWDERGYQTALRAKVKTHGGKSYEVTGKVMSLIPCATAAPRPRVRSCRPASPRG
uniref:DUF7064 domain-containing protein n=1 Tax=Phenylobacterium glaciei TaxID=2803784 RepID=A0A974P7F2_9CAUL|nr:hypothetical protein JKL49_13490 [Phenylobacterium glaciei]